ncbi:hypothetical protein ICN83_13430 [Sphingopyxis granuli]|nr:hypothetical protein ICN83_13430 [Sphingopyxis granuli]
MKQLPRQFETRLLPVDAETAHAWGRIVTAAQAIGRPIGAMERSPKLADFEATGVRLFNPWLHGDQL